MGETKSHESSLFKGLPYRNCRQKITPILGSETNSLFRRISGFPILNRIIVVELLAKWSAAGTIVRSESNLQLYCDCILHEPKELAKNTFSASKIRHMRSNPERAQLINHPRRACPHIAHARCKSRDTGCPCPLNANARLSKLWRIQRPTSFLALPRPWWVHYHIPSSFFSTNFEDQEKRSTFTTDLADDTLSMTSATSNPDRDLTILIWLSQHCPFSLFEYLF